MITAVLLVITSFVCCCQSCIEPCGPHGFPTPAKYIGRGHLSFVPVNQASDVHSALSPLWTNCVVSCSVWGV